MTISLAPTAIAETTLKDPAEADQNLRDITELARYICLDEMDFFHKFYAIPRSFLN